MIAEANGSVVPSGKGYDSFQKTRLSNVKSNNQRNQVPPIDAEESIGKATEDFGGYSLGDDGSGLNKLGYERAIDDSAGLD